MRTPSILITVGLLACAQNVHATTARDNELYAGWLKMYDLKFDDAHRIFRDWESSHPTDPLAPCSQATAYLFSEFARLGVLESELFVNDERFTARKKLKPDARLKVEFSNEIENEERLSDALLRHSPSDERALFAKSLGWGLRADYAALIEKSNLTSLNYTRQARAYAEKVLSVNPQAYDAYLAPGVENYLLSLKPAPLRLMLKLTGSNVDREKGLEQLHKTASQGLYLEPFAKVLLAVAALRDNNRAAAQAFLEELHRRFPGNPLYSRELGEIAAKRETRPDAANSEQQR
jgi:hypothetical protein